MLVAKEELPLMPFPVRFDELFIHRTNAPNEHPAASQTSAASATRPKNGMDYPGVGDSDDTIATALMEKSLRDREGQKCGDRTQPHSRTSISEQGLSANPSPSGTTSKEPRQQGHEPLRAD